MPLRTTRSAAYRTKNATFHHSGCERARKPGPSPPQNRIKELQQCATAFDAGNNGSAAIPLQCTSPSNTIFKLSFKYKGKHN